MRLYPAIDCRAGKCVRLFQGDFCKETIYSESPMEVGKSFLQSGAMCLHLVDLDGAKNPKAHQADLIQSLIKTLPLTIQVGGGIRTLKQVRSYLDSGATRVVLGSIAVEEPDTIKEWFKIFGADPFVLAFDVQNTVVLSQGWQKSTSIAIFDWIERYQDIGVKRILCTDISRDGALCGPNVGLYQSLLERFPGIEFQASGGICSVEDLKDLKSIGMQAAIIGRALYENRIPWEVLSCSVDE